MVSCVNTRNVNEILDESLKQTVCDSRMTEKPQSPTQKIKNEHFQEENQKFCDRLEYSRILATFKKENINHNARMKDHEESDSSDTGYDSY